MSKNDKNDAVQVFDPTPFPILTNDDSVAMITEAFTSMGIDAFKLNRIKIPSGGGRTWTVNELTGEVSTDHIDAIIAGVKGNEKVWWREEFSGAGGPPQCSSNDGVNGRGSNSLEAPDPTAEEGQFKCGKCPWNQWKSDRKGGPGKDCKDTALLLFFRPGSYLPELLIVPPSSLDPLLKYNILLAQAGKRAQHVVTRIKLTPDKSATGIAYSKLELSFQSELGETEKARMAEIAPHVMASVMPLIEITADDLKS